MIEYSKIEGIKCEINDNKVSYRFPFVFEVKSKSGQTLWKTENMSIGHWSHFNPSEDCIATLTDIDGNIVERLNCGQSEVSLLLHTCDAYEGFWSGMFYTLDFYWDFNIPIYFANEETKLSDIKFDCKGKDYFPDKRINQILTGKTDKTGFSDRFIKAIQQIPSKYIIYIQEDMWLKRPLELSTINELVKFMDETNADSVKLHSKLFYYNDYKVESSDYTIEDKNLLRQTSGYLLSHNATLWRKDYILKHQLGGEDPWKNETAGSERMSKYPHQHYLYNIHWYCQPGIADFGKPSNEHSVYAHIVDQMMFMKLEYGA